MVLNPTQDCSPLWCQQVGYLGRVSEIHRSHPWLRGQSQNCLEQGRPGLKNVFNQLWTRRIKVNFRKLFRLTTKSWCECMVLSCGQYLRWSISCISRNVSHHMSLSYKVINVPECPKIYVGSFWDQQLKHDLYRRLFEKELQSLFDDLQDLPR